jgi:hypothetical protein
MLILRQKLMMIKSQRRRVRLADSGSATSDGATNKNGRNDDDDDAESDENSAKQFVISIEAQDKEQQGCVVEPPPTDKSMGDLEEERIV